MYGHGQVFKHTMADHGDKAINKSGHHTSSLDERRTGINLASRGDPDVAPRLLGFGEVIVRKRSVFFSFWEG